MSAKTTNRGKRRRPNGDSVAEMREEYRLDYAKSRPNRFAARLRGGAHVVVLDPDVAKVFRDPKQVNAFLRAAIAATERRRARRTS